MKLTIASLSILAVLTFAAIPAPAQDGGRRAAGAEGRRGARAERIQKFLNEHPDVKARIEEWKKLTPGQRKERVAQKKAEFKALTPDERKARIQRFREEHPRMAKRMGRSIRMGMKARVMRRMMSFGEGTPVTR